MKNLKTYRKELQEPKCSRERLARLSDISLHTLERAESGKGVIKYSTAKSITDALNTLRKSQGLSRVSVVSLHLKLW